MVPLLVVSPEGADAAKRISGEENLKEVYWQFHPNDMVLGTVLRWRIDSVRIWSEGAGQAAMS